MKTTNACFLGKADVANGRCAAPQHPLRRYQRDQAIKELSMDSEHIKGAADKAKGAIKDAAGKLTGDQKLQTEGKVDKAKGAAHDVAGNIKDAARDLTK
jgi:uncharacterized protein YjbJ (UPF0337 family)